MKKIIFLLIAFMGILTIESCKKEQISSEAKTNQQVEITDVESRSYQEEECGNISRLCPTCEIQEATATVELGSKVDGSGMVYGVDDNKITIVIGSEEYIIHPAEYFKGSSIELLIKHRGKELLYSDTDLKIKRETEPVEIPTAVELLKNINQEAFKDGSISISAIKEILGQDVTVVDEGNGNFRIFVNNTTTTTSDKIWEDPCQGKNFKKVVRPVYLQVLGRENPHLHYESIVISALEEYLDIFYLENGFKFDFKTGCVNTQKVIDIVLQNPEISGSFASPRHIN